MKMIAMSKPAGPQNVPSGEMMSRPEMATPIKMANATKLSASARNVERCQSADRR